MNKRRGEKHKIVLSYPYDGAFIWLLGKDQMRHNHGGRYRGGHSYYELLYGRYHYKVAPRAASLAILYDEIIIAPADVGLPDYKDYVSGSRYFNPLIGLYHDWEDYRINRDLLEEVSRRDLHDHEITQFLPKVDERGKKFILERVNLQIILARQHDAKILVGPLFKRIFDVKLGRERKSQSTQNIEIEKPQKISSVDRYFRIACFEFKDPQYEDLVALKEDKLVQKYAANFHKTMEQAVTTEKTYDTFMELIEKSMSHKEFYRKVRAVFSMGGRISTWSGWIPGWGIIASGVSIVKDIGQYYIEKKGEIPNSWYLLGPRMSEVILHRHLRDT